MQSTLFHLTPIVERRLPNIVLWLVLLVSEHGVFLVKLVQAGRELANQVAAG